MQVKYLGSYEKDNVQQQPDIKVAIVNSPVERIRQLEEELAKIRKLEALGDAICDG